MVLSTKQLEGAVAHELNAEDRQAIGEVLSLHGHLFDGGHLGRLGEIFAPDVVYDMSAVGVGTFEGIETIRSAALQLGAGNPVAHHVTNIVISGGGGRRPRNRAVQGPDAAVGRDARQRDTH
jgi:hypothetical protein